MFSQPILQQYPDNNPPENRTPTSMKITLKSVTLPLALAISQSALSPVLAQTAPAQTGMAALEDFDYWNNLCRLQLQSGNAEEALPACEQAIALKPKDETAWANFSYAHLTLEQYPESLAAGDRLLTLNDQNALAMTHQCMAYLGLGQTETALDTCNKALETNSFWGTQSPALALRTRGQILNQIDQPHQALIAYNRALQLDPDDSLTLAYRCQTLVDSANILATEASTDSDIYRYGISACEDARAGNGQWQTESPALAWAYEGQARVQQRDYAGAIAAYDQALALEPENPEHWLQQARLLEQRSNFAAATLSYSRAVELVPDSSRALVGQCVTLNQQAQYEPAKAACEQALAGKGDWWELGAAQAWHGLAKAMASLGEYEPALAAADRAVGIKPDYLEAQGDRSVILWYLEEYVKAYDASIAITQQLPENETNKPFLSNIWTNIGRIRSSQDMPFESINAYDRAIEHNRKNIDAWTNRSATLWSLNRYDEALLSANRAIDIDNQSEQGWQNKAAAQATLHLFIAAEASYKTTIEINNQNAEAWAGLGALQLQRQDTEAAMESLEIAIQLNPHQALARRILEMLDDAAE